MSRNIPPLLFLSALLILGGLAALVYFAAFFDVSISLPSEASKLLGISQVNNLSLMQDRQTGLLFSSLSIITGLILTAIIILQSKAGSPSPHGRGTKGEGNCRFSPRTNGEGNSRRSPSPRALLKSLDRED